MAGAASAFGAVSAEASITYSGPINQEFSGRASGTFPLEGVGNFLVALHHSNGSILNEGSYGATFYLRGTTPSQGRAVAGFLVNSVAYASKLRFGQTINLRPFAYLGALLAGSRYPSAPWNEVGTGFLGFRFKGPGGLQYGWARIDFTDSSHHDFTFIDYAFADPGERITAGQTGGTVPESGGSLGLLALGCAGLLAWRTARPSNKASSLNV